MAIAIGKSVPSGTALWCGGNAPKRWARSSPRAAGYLSKVHYARRVTTTATATSATARKSSPTTSSSPVGVEAEVAARATKAAVVTTAVEISTGVPVAELTASQTSTAMGAVLGRPPTRTTFRFESALNAFAV